MSEKKKRISNDESMELCALLSALTMKYQQLRELPSALKKCLAEEANADYDRACQNC